MRIETPEYKEVSTETERKLKFLGFCSKCNKDAFHRWIGGGLGWDEYKCLKCKTINRSVITYK